MTFCGNLLKFPGLFHFTRLRTFAAGAARHRPTPESGAEAQSFYLEKVFAGERQRPWMTRRT
ncbi:hypothetical protein, partial [Escherichia coli]|uniref:hypothetical protein n=1 Tax=Escherichia coli TaxID=562 RepID=UPI003D2F2A8A